MKSLYRVEYERFESSENIGDAEWIEDESYVVSESMQEVIENRNDQRTNILSISKVTNNVEIIDS